MFYVALITPFTDTFEIDEDALRRVVSWHLEGGTSGFVCCGSTGEHFSLTREEQLRVTKIVLEEVRGRAAVLACTGEASTSETVAKTQRFKKLGVDGTLIATPHYVKPTQEGCYLHYSEVDKVGLPIMVYHHPGRTGFTFELETLLRVCELDSVFAVKEASGSRDFACKLIGHTDVYAGDDSEADALIARGAKGCVSALNNVVPGMKAVSGFEELVEALSLETNPQCIKFAVARLGLCKPHLRLPLIQPQERTKKKILTALEKLVKVNAHLFE